MGTASWASAGAWAEADIVEQTMNFYTRDVNPPGTPVTGGLDVSEVRSVEAELLGPGSPRSASATAGMTEIFEVEC